MDLNGLKRCNDCFGYAAGDALICRVADALNDVFLGEACRIGGDEFVVICCPGTQEKFEQQVDERGIPALPKAEQLDGAEKRCAESLVPADLCRVCKNGGVICHSLKTPASP